MSHSLHDHRYTVFRKLLLARRESMGITQSKLAERLGKPQSYVSKYERGERRLDVVEFVEIAQALGVEPNDILGELVRRIAR